MKSLATRQQQRAARLAATKGSLAEQKRRQIAERKLGVRTREHFSGTQGVKAQSVAQILWRGLGGPLAQLYYRIRSGI